VYKKTSRTRHLYSNWIFRSGTHQLLSTSGLSPNSNDRNVPGYLAPFVPPTLSIAVLIVLTSSLVNSVWMAAAFSFKYLICLVPGIGMRSLKISTENKD
jgi:hypothetical protein